MSYSTLGGKPLGKELQEPDVMPTRYRMKCSFQTRAHLRFNYTDGPPECCMNGGTACPGNVYKEVDECGGGNRDDED